MGGTLSAAVQHHGAFPADEVHSCDSSGLFLLDDAPVDPGAAASLKDRRNTRNSGHAQKLLRGLRLLDKTQRSSFRSLLPFWRSRRRDDTTHAAEAPDDDNDAQSDPDFLARAKAVAFAVTPFLPARVSTAFAAGVGRSGATSGAAPRRSQAALLIVDVSGFTSLSEDAQKRYGSEGVEHFSLAISRFFAVMMELIVSFQGDVDCFAGDAVLIVFEPRRKDADPSLLPHDGAEADCGFIQPGVVSEFEPRCGTSQQLLEATVRRALECAKAIHAELEGFRDDPQDHPLSMHSGLAAGALRLL